jgi:mono/diheme cytochrome c family protein
VRFALAALGAGAALLAAGCGTGGLARGNPDTATGAKLFSAKCAACHTLAAANASGTIGPNLDDAFRADKQQGFKQSAIVNVVLDQIRLANAPMPKNLYTGQDAEDVAAYVAGAAGTGKVNAPPPSELGTDGKAVFANNGCGACHTLTAAGSKGTIGPDLDKLPAYATQAKQPLEPFVRQSIVNPNAYIQPGFPKNVMPQTFGSSLSKAQLDALVQYLISSSKKG